MSLGIGNSVFTNQKSASGGGTLTGANNGLSIDGTDVQLGGNPLIEETSIDLDSWHFSINEGAGKVLNLDPANMIFGIGDLDGIGNGSNLMILDATEAVGLFAGNSIAGVGFQAAAPGLALITSAGNEYLSLDAASGVFGIGDLDSAGNGTRIQIGDTARYIKFYGATAATIFDLNYITKEYKLGDVSGQYQNTMLTIDDGNAAVSMKTFNNLVFYARSFDDTYKFGDLHPRSAGTHLFIQSNADYAKIISGGNTYLDINPGSDSYEMGDISGALNSTKIRVDDGAETVTVDADNGLVYTTVPTGTNTDLSPLFIDSTNNKVSKHTPTAYAISNPTTNRTIDVSGGTLSDVRQVLGTLLQDLIDIGIFVTA